MNDDIVNSLRRSTDNLLRSISFNRITWLQDLFFIFLSKFSIILNSNEKGITDILPGDER
jgi:hypothetical protein